MVRQVLVIAPFHYIPTSVIIGKRILTADGDGTLIFWDPRSSTPLWKLTPDDGRFELDGITSLAVNPGSTVAVVGGASGGIRVVNLHKGDIVGSLAAHKEGESVETIAFVGFAGTAEVVVTGSTDGRACVWDLNTLKVRNTLEHEVSFGPVSGHWIFD
jgi:ribosome assembly protein SQT1